MKYPFIYTRTKIHDYRLVTSDSLGDLPDSIVQNYTEAARAVINAENTQLLEPSWILVKKDGYILWGIAVLNKVLGDKNQDRDMRPVRGFFGFITDENINSLPYSISFFKELYDLYVMPIWDSFRQTEQIRCQFPPLSGDSFILKSPRLNDEISVSKDNCRIFPFGSDSKGLIEAVFASDEDCSIATNIHHENQCIEFGNNRLSILNIVMSADSDITEREDIKIWVKEEPIVHSYADRIVIEGQSDGRYDAVCSECGRIVYGNDTLCPECKSKHHNKRLIKFALYGILLVVCIFYALRCSGGIGNILSQKPTRDAINIKDGENVIQRGRTHETKTFQMSNKSEIPKQNIIDKDNSIKTKGKTE